MGLALRQRALADLIERLAARDAGKVERDDHADAVGAARPLAGPVKASAVVRRHVGERNMGYGAVRDPCRGLAVDDDLVGTDARDEIAARLLAAWRKLLVVENRPIGAAVRLRVHPAP